MTISACMRNSDKAAQSLTRPTVHTAARLSEVTLSARILFVQSKRQLCDAEIVMW